jgi:hypothetical protein
VIVYGREKTGQSRQAKFGEKGGKVKKYFKFVFKYFFSKDTPLIHFVHPKGQKYIQKCLKIAPNVIKINSIYSNLIILFKLQKDLKITFFQDQTFQLTKYLRYCDALCTEYSARDID